MSDIENHINYALVEDVRPPMYKAMKYWGKKPHNIWSDYIKSYCPQNGVVLDVFAGSGLVAFESIILNRKAYVFDLNPLTNFFVDVTLEPFNQEKFECAVEQIVEEIENDDIYISHYLRTYNEEELVIYNYIWYSSDITNIRVKTKDGKDRPDLKPSEIDKKLALELSNINIPYWYPTDKFPINPSINQKFIDDIGGDNFSFLWTKRNLYILSKIFSFILKNEEDIVKPLLYAFIHTLHLVSKMVYPRTKKGNRKYSGSWGRADYMIRKNSMEQNPLVVFLRSCFDKQGVVKAILNAKERLPSTIKMNEVSYSNKIKKSHDLNFGTIDVADLCDFVDEESIDFIITDPPYGGLVQYLDLSMIWLIWLKKYNEKYAPNIDAEITVKRGYVDRDEYIRKITNAFKNLHKVLKKDGYMVVTFHNQEMQEWNDFVNAIRSAGFKFDKVTHQYNKRSGESNVSNPYGTTGSDFYIRCVKQRNVDFTDDKSEFEHFILMNTIDIIASRCEKTPFGFIVNGLLPEMLQAGHLRPDEPTEELTKILGKYIGKDQIFEVTKNDNTGAGDYWWFNNPKAHINFPNLPLTDRVEEAVLSLMRRKVSVKYDDVIAEIFKKYPNGLTPDPRGIRKVVEKYAVPISGKWKLKEDIVIESTKHTDIICKLSKICKKSNMSVFVGKREQPEVVRNGQILRDYCDFVDIKEILPSSTERERIDRINMIDEIWIDSMEIKCIFEVENSTKFTMALQRASNLDKKIPKILVIPDNRENELLRISDPVFKELFNEYNWHYLLYSSVERMASSRSIDMNTVLNTSKKLN